MLDGPILSEYFDQFIYISPSQLLKQKLKGHVNNLFCWCAPILVDYQNPNGHVTKEIGHKNIIYDFGGNYESEE